MKKVTRAIVIATMNLLIMTNGQTTTLEVKSHLRDLGFNVNQIEVSNMMSEIQKASTNLTFTENGQYRVYSHINEDEEYDEEYYEAEEYDDEDEEYDEEYEEEEELTEDDFVEVKASGMFDEFLTPSETETITKYNDSVLNKNGTTADKVNSFNAGLEDDEDIVMVTTAPYVATTKPMNISTYFKLEHALISPEVSDDDETWIVKAKDSSVTLRDGTRLANVPIHTFDSELTSDKVRSRYATLLKCKIQDVRARRAGNYKM